MLINLSNHPSDRWGKKQLELASRYGEIKDLPFPAVDPRCTSEEIDELVERCYQQIMAYENPVIMLQGEFVFTYRLVNRLKAAGLTVVAGCSERKTTEHMDESGNITKQSVFDFVCFREY